MNKGQNQVVPPMSQFGGQNPPQLSSIPPVVNPVVVQNRTSPGTPFITNKAKEIYNMRQQEEISSDSEEEESPIEPTKSKYSKDSRDSRDTRDFRKPKKDSRNMLGSLQKTGTEIAYEPAVKFEMILPKVVKPSRPETPLGIYEQYTPILPPVNNNRFNPAAFQHLFAPSSALLYGPSVKMPMQNVYNINLPGPTGGHVAMDKIYENILPGKNVKCGFSTLGERIQMLDYIRQILVSSCDGENISIDSSGGNSLLSYIKLMEINPNFYSTITNNPYKGLPYGLLIYRSCFPIRFEPTNQSVVCAKNSIGLNIRLYALSYAEYYSYKLNNSVYLEYDVWRELMYYEYVKNRIIKSKQSPNFPILYAYFFCPNRNINFFQLKTNCLTRKELLSEEYKKFRQVHEAISNTGTNKIIRPMSMSGKNDKCQLPDEVDPLFRLYSGTTLILITEAPHHNLYQWASRTYETDGIVQRMTSSGFYDEKIWYDILFQIVSALYVMQIHGIYIRNMTIEDSVYIKDLKISGKSCGYWKWIIDGIPYYVPNYGYLVMIDSNFKDTRSESTLLDRDCCEREYKIYANNIYSQKYDNNVLNDNIFENYRRIINTNAFTKEHTKNNVMRPPESIMRLIELMSNDPEKNLGTVLHKYFRKYLNNRIGTLLRRDTEIPNIRDVTRQFNNGEMAVEVIGDQMYKWCMVTKTNSDGTVEIITRSDSNLDDYIIKNVRIETLKQYSPYENIDQNLDQEVKLDDNPLETYTISPN